MLTASPRRSGVRPRVLFVDDEPEVVESIAELIRHQYNVVTARGGHEALRVLASAGPFVVVVSDFAMPGMNGAQFLARAKVAAPSTIRVLLTGQATLDGTIAAVNEGNIFRFLTKPCSPRDLFRVLDDAVEQARLVTADRELLEAKLETMSGHLLRAERLASLGTMAAAIGHELNNALTVFGGTIDFIKEDLASGRKPTQEDLDGLEKVRERLESHARNLLQLGRPRRSGEPESTDLGKVIAETSSLLQNAGILRQVALELDLPAAPVLVAMGRTEAEQVLVNFLKNAADAAKEAHGKDDRAPKIEVKLATAPDGVTALCSVKDNGGGIPETKRALVFEPYFTTKSTDQGTGLGLFVVRQILQRHKGSVAVTSEVGRGTSFTASIPLAAA